MSSETVFLYPHPNRMRIIVFFILIISFISVEAQTHLPLSGMNYTQRDAFNHYNSISDSNNANKKWSLYKYGGFSASSVFFNGGNATVFSAPIGLQLNRRINNNLYAFAAIGVAPSYINFNRSFINSDINKNNAGINRYSTNGFSMFSKFEAGLMYVNDAKTFSISGSIGVYESSFPGNPSFNGTNVQRQQPINSSRQ
jgi:hypothetical protein